ncbi:unnamed protein product, partial [marine sediment metagenome]
STDRVLVVIGGVVVIIITAAKTRPVNVNQAIW